MVDIGKILKRSWHILWNYRILWVFGVFLALTTGGAGRGNAGSGTNGSPSSSSSTSLPPFLQDFGRTMTDWFQTNVEPLFLHPEQHLATFILIGLILVLFGLMITIVFAFVRYVSEAAVIRMVDQFEQTGGKVGFRQGWRMGWSRAAFRMWLIDLLIGLVTIPFLLILGLLALAAYFSFKSGLSFFAVSGLVISIGCALLLILAFVLLMILLGLLSYFFKRKVALENAGVGASIRAGWEMFRRNWKSAALMWLVMLGIGIAYGIASLILLVFLIPVFVLLAVPGLVVAAVPAAAAFGITSVFTNGPLTWIVALLVGTPFFLLIVGSPLLLVNGWVQIYGSSVWTLTYREIKALEAVANPEPAQPGS